MSLSSFDALVVVVAAVFVQGGASAHFHPNKRSGARCVCITQTLANAKRM